MLNMLVVFSNREAGSAERVTFFVLLWPPGAGMPIQHPPGAGIDMNVQWDKLDECAVPEPWNLSGQAGLAGLAGQLSANPAPPPRGGGGGGSGH